MNTISNNDNINHHSTYTSNNNNTHDNHDTTAVGPGLPNHDDVYRVLRDVVFQGVGFESDGFNHLAHISFRCEVPTPSVVEGQINKYISYVQNPHPQTPHP